MAQMEFQTAEGKKTKRRIHPSLRIDMTPMVDLGFLLITFFIFTTTMSEKSMMKLYMPHDGDSSVVGKSKVLSVLLGQDNKLYAFEGDFKDAIQENKIIATSYDEGDGIGNLIRQKQKQLKQTKEDGGNELLFLIKPTDQSTYKNVIDALDETTINGVKKYMIVDASAKEKTYLQRLVQ